MTFKIGDKVRRTEASEFFPLEEYTVGEDPGCTDWFRLKETDQFAYMSKWELVPQKPTPHKHAALIKAWADNPELVIECQRHNDGIWMETTNPGWFTDYEYRIKPEPKPDIKVSRGLQYHLSGSFMGSLGSGDMDNVQYTFDGETGKLKAVEMI